MSSILIDQWCPRIWAQIWGVGGLRRGLIQWVQLCTWSPNKLCRSNSIFNLWTEACCWCTCTKVQLCLSKDGFGLLLSPPIGMLWIKRSAMLVVHKPWLMINTNMYYLHNQTLPKKMLNYKRLTLFYSCVASCWPICFTLHMKILWAIGCLPSFPLLRLFWGLGGCERGWGGRGEEISWQYRWGGIYRRLKNKMPIQYIYTHYTACRIPLLDLILDDSSLPPPTDYHPL